MPVIHRLVNTRAKKSASSTVSFSSRRRKPDVKQTSTTAQRGGSTSAIDKLRTLIQAPPSAVAEDATQATNSQRGNGAEDNSSAVRRSVTQQYTSCNSRSSCDDLLVRLSVMLHGVYVVALTEKAQLGLPIYSSSSAAHVNNAQARRATLPIYNSASSSMNSNIKNSSATVTSGIPKEAEMTMKSQCRAIESEHVAETTPHHNTPTTLIWNVVVNERFCYNVTRYCQFTVTLDDVAKVAAAFPHLLRLRWTALGQHMYRTSDGTTHMNAIHAIPALESTLTARAYLLGGRVPSPEHVRDECVASRSKMSTCPPGKQDAAQAAHGSMSQWVRWLASITAYGSYMEQQQREAEEQMHIVAQNEEVLHDDVQDEAASSVDDVSPANVSNRGTRKPSRAQAKHAAWEKAPRGNGCNARPRTTPSAVESATITRLCNGTDKSHSIIAPAMNAKAGAQHRTTTVGETVRRNTRQRAVDTHTLTKSTALPTHTDDVDDETLLAQLSVQLRASLSEEKLRGLLAQMRRDASQVDAKETARINRSQEMERVMAIYEHIHSLFGLERRSMNAAQLLHAIQNEGHFDGRRSARAQLQFLLQCEPAGLSAVSMTDGNAAQMPGHVDHPSRPSADATASALSDANDPGLTSLCACNDIMSLTDSQVQLVLVTLDRSKASMPRFRDFVQKAIRP